MATRIESAADLIAALERRKYKFELMFANEHPFSIEELETVVALLRQRFSRNRIWELGLYCRAPAFFAKDQFLDALASSRARVHELRFNCVRKPLRFLKRVMDRCDVQVLSVNLARDERPYPLRDMLLELNPFHELRIRGYFEVEVMLNVKCERLRLNHPRLRFVASALFAAKVVEFRSSYTGSIPLLQSPVLEVAACNLVPSIDLLRTDLSQVQLSPNLRELALTSGLLSTRDIVLIASRCPKLHTLHMRVFEGDFDLSLLPPSLRFLNITVVPDDDGYEKLRAFMVKRRHYPMMVHVPFPKRVGLTRKLGARQFLLEINSPVTVSRRKQMQRFEERRFLVMNFRRAIHARRDAPLAVQAAARGWPMELRRRLLWGQFALREEQIRQMLDRTPSEACAAALRALLERRGARRVPNTNCENAG